MRTRTLGIVVVLLALSAFATSAAASKPKLWLSDAASHVHATAGEAAHLRIGVADHCGGAQAASVSTNGKPTDHIAPAGALTTACDEGYKLAGTIKSVTLAPGSEGVAAVMTVSGLMHLGVEPWCTYTLPRKVAIGMSVLTEAGSRVVTATLDKSASFASCAPTREMFMSMTLEQVSEEFPYEVELAS
jgi:hypothetical protein